MKATDAHSIEFSSQEAMEVAYSGHNATLRQVLRGQQAEQQPPVGVLVLEGCNNKCHLVTWRRETIICQ